MRHENWTVELTRRCLVKKNSFSIKKWKNAAWVSGTELEEGLFNNCGQGNIDG